MNPFDLQPTNFTPAVSFKENQLTIKGRSIPVNESVFYDPYISWARELKISKLSVDLNFEYMNSGSTKKILELLKTLDLNHGIEKMNVHWYYEEGDEEMLEHGKVFEKLLKRTEYQYISFRDAE